MAAKATTDSVKKDPKKKKKKDDRIPFHRRPEGMDMEKWQIALRKQFVEDNDFGIEKISHEIVYADYFVNNPASKGTYKVALRSPNHRGHNFCNCYDFRVSRLGTCKHIEAVFRLIAKKRLKKHLKNREERTYSSVYLDYRAGKHIMLRIGTEHTEELAELSFDYFDDQFNLTENGLAHFGIPQKSPCSQPRFSLLRRCAGPHPRTA